MSPITGRDFQSALPLDSAALAILDEANRSAWMEPSKIHHQSAQLRIALDAARQSIATNLGVRVEELEFVGELGFGFWSAISGLITGAAAGIDSSEITLHHSPIDRQIVHAFAREQQTAGGKVEVATIDVDGRFDFASNLASNSVVLWQATNREIGVEQRAPESEEIALFADMTARFDPKSLPNNWQVALWDPRSFGGPEGIALLAIKSGSKWRSPIPAIDQRRLFGSYSKPLLLAAAQALDSWSDGLAERRLALLQMNQLARKLLGERIAGIRIAGQLGDPRYLGFGIPGVIAEELLREVERGGYLIDAGSACGAGALSPSHVMEAIGMSGLGHIRLTFKAEQSESDVLALVDLLANATARLR